MVELIGANFETWRRSRAECDVSFNPIATELPHGDDKNVRCCQKKRCMRLRKGIEKGPEGYEGDLFCEECRRSEIESRDKAAVGEDETLWREATWYQVIHYGDKIGLRQLRCLPKILILPLLGTSWLVRQNVLAVPAQKTTGQRANFGFSLLNGRDRCGVGFRGLRRRVWWSRGTGNCQ